MDEVKLTDFGAATPKTGMSKEDERSAALAARAQKGDYDDGRVLPIPAKISIANGKYRTHPRAIGTESSLPYGRGIAETSGSIHNHCWLWGSWVSLHSSFG